MRGDRKGKPCIHTARIEFHRQIEKTFKFRKVHDLVETGTNFRPRHA
jgi:hypothetical protein